MSKIVECLNSLKDSMLPIPELRDKVTVVFDPEELLRVVRGVAMPAVGVVYEGMTGIVEQGATAKGLGAIATFGLYLAVDATPISMSVDQKSSSLILLSSMRSLLAEARGPGGHYWQFLSESYSDSVPNRSLWIQRWSSRLMVTS